MGPWNTYTRDEAIDELAVDLTAENKMRGRGGGGDDGGNEMWKMMMVNSEAAAMAVAAATFAAC